MLGFLTISWTDSLVAGIYVAYMVRFLPTSALRHSHPTHTHKSRSTREAQLGEVIEIVAVDESAEARPSLLQLNLQEPSIAAFVSYS